MCLPSYIIYTTTAAPWADFSCTCRIYITEKQDSSIRNVTELCTRQLWKWGLIQGSGKRLHPTAEPKMAWLLGPHSGQYMLFFPDLKLPRHVADDSPITCAMASSTSTPFPLPPTDLHIMSCGCPLSFSVFLKSVSVTAACRSKLNVSSCISFGFNIIIIIIIITWVLLIKGYKIWMYDGLKWYKTYQVWQT